MENRGGLCELVVLAKLTILESYETWTVRKELWILKWDILFWTNRSQILFISKKQGCLYCTSNENDGKCRITESPSTAMTSSCFSLGNAFYALERHIGITCIFDFWLVCQDESVQVHCDSDEIHTDLTPGCRLHLVEAQNPWETTDNYETPLVSRVRSHTFEYMGITNIASYSRSALLSARMPPPAVIPTIRSE